jgi:hypothetical protein
MAKRRSSQYNGQRKKHSQKKDKGINNDQQNTMKKTKDRAKRTPLNTGGECRCSGGVAVTTSIPIVSSNG